MSADVSYPLEVEGRLDPQLSRWLWLVKWLLAIPHIVVLAFLWIAFFVLTFVALVAIVFTGRYPRSLFEFNVGVLRWSWRVGFYTFAALGTDRYPPFTLGSAPDYPARLDVVYPARLSRGLALVKWWLLAIPQYVIVAFLLGGGTRWNWVASSVGLIDVLVLFAGVALLFTGRYPQGIFDLVVGLDRWALRVAAYAGLMTDRYPPFRLDMGGTEPAAQLAALEAAPAEAAPAARARRWTFGRVVLVVLGSLAALLAFGLATSGAAALVVDHTQRDGDGYLMSPSKHLSTGSYALVSQPTNLGSDVTGRDFLGTVRSPHRERQASVRRHRPVGRRGRLPGRHAARGGQRDRALARRLRPAHGWPATHTARFADLLVRVRHRDREPGAGLEALGRHLEGCSDERRRLTPRSRRRQHRRQARQLVLGRRRTAHRRAPARIRRSRPDPPRSQAHRGISPAVTRSRTDELD